jgi:hypothetical protein
VTTIERVFLAKWHAKHQATYRYPTKGKPRQGKFCFVCNWFVDDSDVLGACEAEDELDEAEEELDTENTVLTIKSHSMEDAQCELRLYTVYFVTCTISQMKIPLGNIRESQLRFGISTTTAVFAETRKSSLPQTSSNTMCGTWSVSRRKPYGERAQSGPSRLV